MSYEFRCLEDAAEEFKRRLGLEEIPTFGPLDCIDYSMLLSLLNISALKELEDRNREDYLFLVNLFDAQEKELVSLVLLGRTAREAMDQMERKMARGDECDCECHEPGKVIMHCAPCCTPCPDCGKNIRGNMIDIHKKYRCAGRKPPIPVSGEPYGTAR